MCNINTLIWIYPKLPIRTSWIWIMLSVVELRIPTKYEWLNSFQLYSFFSLIDIDCLFLMLCVWLWTRTGLIKCHINIYTVDTAQYGRNENVLLVHEYLWFLRMMDRLFPYFNRPFYLINTKRTERKNEPTSSSFSLSFALWLQNAIIPMFDFCFCTKHHNQQFIYINVWGDK